jgi:class 3 adenylate cyclase
MRKGLHVEKRPMRVKSSRAMKRYVFFLTVFLSIVMGGSLTPSGVPCLVERFLHSAHAQTSEGDSSKKGIDSPPTEEPPMEGQRGGTMGGGMTGMGNEEMGRMMREVIPPKEIPFYRETTFHVVMTAVLVLLILWLIKRWGDRRWSTSKAPGPFVNEAVLVVDLCESTKLAVTRGDAFAMGITNKMKECVRDVSESLGAGFFENTGDGYLITFPTGVSAVSAAIKILKNADAYNRETPEKEKIELRVGINYGEMVLDEKGQRHGVAINKAFRIEGLSRDQQRLGDGLKPEGFPEKNRIFVSEEIIEEIKAVGEIQVRELGVFDLRGFTGLHRVYSVPWRDVAVDQKP